MSYANMDGVPTQTAGTSELLASDWNTYVRDNFDSIKFGHVVCDSGTRPTGIAEGTMIYETDTQKVLVYSGASWVEISDIDRAGGLPETSPGHLIVADDTAKAALTPTEGMMVYQSDNNKIFVYSGSAWVEVSDIDSTPAPSGVGKSVSIGTTVSFNNVGSSWTNLGANASSLSSTFVKKYTNTAVAVNLNVSMVELNSGLEQAYAFGMYNPTSGGAEVGTAWSFGPGVSRSSFAGSNVIWAGLAAGSYTVQPVFKEFSAAAIFVLRAGGYNSISSHVNYNLIEVNV